MHVDSWRLRLKHTPCHPARASTLSDSKQITTRNRYLLTCEPTGVGKDDGWHTLEVRLKSKRGTVKARPGYVAGK